MHAARRHAVMRRLDDDADALRLEDVIDGVGDLRRHLFLDLQTLGIDVDDARQLADADHAAVGNVGHPGLADDRRHVVLAMALEADAAQHDHLVIAFGLLEGLLQDLGGVLTVAREELLERARHARRRLAQAVPIRIFAGPSDDGAHRRLDFGSIRPLSCGQRRSCAIQCMYIRVHRDTFPRRLPTELEPIGCCVVRKVPGKNYPVSAAFTRPLALPKSIWPAYFARSTPITLPMSFMPAAPVSAMAAAIAAFTSSSDICFGR